MHNNVMQDVTAAVEKNRRKSIWKRIVSVLASIVVFCTTYALILPALTLERPAECGIEEHTHTEACYIKDDTASADILVCNAETLGLHMHTAACIGMDGAIVCGYSDFVIHSHNEFCFDESGALVCTLSEILPHIHTDLCYPASEDSGSGLFGALDADYDMGLDDYGMGSIIDSGMDSVIDTGIDSGLGHIHTDDCYITEPGELICTLSAEAAHVHTDECYLTTNELSCPLPEGEGHIHGDGCFDEAGALVCTVPESAAHTHVPECYQTSSELICTLGGSEQVHIHTDECYAKSRILVCEIPQELSFADDGLALPSPGSEPYDGFGADGWWTEQSSENTIPQDQDTIINDTAESDRGEPVCGIPEIIPHSHIDSCFDGSGMPICGMTEVLEHIHTPDCMGAAYDSDELTCTIAEGDGAHIHTVEGGCFDEEGALICEIPESEGHIHTVLCYGSWTLICEIEEHTHTEECYPSDDTDPEADPARKVFCGKEAHTHEGKCINENGVVVCLIEEHKHSAECYIDPFAGIETFCGKVEHVHAEECFDENGVMICAVEEHWHEAKCYEAKPLTSLGESFAIAELVEVESFETLDIMTFAMDGVPDAGITPREGPHDFTDNINRVILQHNVNGVWTNVPSGYIVAPDEEVRFEINYLLPGHTVSADNAKIEYQMPPVVSVTGPWTGEVTKANGKDVVGSFTLDSNGIIIITFDEEFAKNNNNGSEINGKVYVKGKIDYNRLSGNDQTISFSSKVHIDPITILKPDNSNLTVQKSGSTVNEDGTIDYKITISSSNGTTNPVKITDSMTNVTLDGDITITGPGNTPFVPQTAPSVSDNRDSFSFELPAMNPGDTYEITYKGKLPEDYDSSKVNIDTNNNVRAESDKNDKTKIDIPFDCKVTYTQNYLSKVGALSSDGDNITWTITINEGKHNLNGWSLYDTFNNQPLPASSFPLKLLDSHKNVIAEITSLPYTFNGNFDDTYTITYVTPAEAPINSDKATNKVFLDDPDQSPGVEFEEQVTISKTFEPVVKTAKSMEIDKVNDKLILTWKVKIDANVAAIPATWWYQDNIDNDYSKDHYLTEEQYNALCSAVGEAFIKAFGENNYQYNIEKQINYTEKIKGFKITSNTALPKGSAIEFEYKTTAEYKGGTQELDYKNTGQVNGNGGSEAHAKYKPLLQKIDAMANNGNSQTSHEYKDLTEGILKWSIYVSKPDIVDGDLILTEKLPTGLNLEKMEISLSNSSYWKSDITNDGSHEIKSWSGADGTNPEYPIFNVAKVSNADGILITLPEVLLKYKNYDRIEVYIEAKIPADYKYPVVSGDISTGMFENTATLTNRAGDELDSKSQTQIITKDDAKPPLKKGMIHDPNNNEIPYRLTVNPTGKDLLPDSDNPLTLTDTLTAEIDENDNGAVRYELVDGSVQVFECDSEGNKGRQLNIRDFPYTFSETKDQYNNNHYYTIRMTVPDETPLIIEYKYKAYTAAEVRGTNVNNKATLEGVESKNEDIEVKKWFEAKQAGAIADQKYVTLIKVDGENNGVYLQGAEFELWKYEPTAANAVDGYIKIDHDKDNKPLRYITDDSGKLDLYIDVNCAYYVKEISAPLNYKLNETPTHFMLYDASLITSSPEMKPDGWSGSKLSMAMSFHVENIPAYTSIEVLKNWQNEKGTTIDPKVNSITVQLKCKAYDKASKQHIKDIDLAASPDHDGISSQVTVTKEENWLHTVDGLPKYGTVDGKEVYYVYSVEEITASIPGFKSVDYQNNSGITTGTITITNTVETEPKHELPQTGGGGMTPITALGGGVMAITLILALIKSAGYKNRRKEDFSSS